MIRWSVKLIAASIPTAQASYQGWEKICRLVIPVDIRLGCQYVNLWEGVCNSGGEKNHTLNLAIIQVAESSDNLLLVELICLQFHTPHGLHGAIILQTLIASHNHLCGWGFIQFVDIAFLSERKYPETQRLFYNITEQRSLSLILTLISKVAWVVKSEYVRADMRAAAPCRAAHKNNRFQIHFQKIIYLS